MKKYFDIYNSADEIVEELNSGELLKPYVALVGSANTLDYNTEEVFVPYESRYFTIKALSAGTLNVYVEQLSQNGNDLYYSKDGGEWTLVEGGEGDVVEISVIANSEYRFKCNYTTSKSNYYTTFGGGNTPIEVYGNAMSLLYGDNFENQYALPEIETGDTGGGGESESESGSDTGGGGITLTGIFQNMFSLNQGLKSAENLVLQASALTNNCYESMFQGCTSLTTAPELPATTVAEYCYSYMFSDCTSLTTAPELPATTLANNCYSDMFHGCTSLTTAPELSATTLAESCYESMFNNCNSLTTAPELPATTLANTCYQFMFWGCSQLNYIKCLATDISAFNCTTYWVRNVSSTGTFVKAPSMTGWTTGDSGIPANWTVEDD